MLAASMGLGLSKLDLHETAILIEKDYGLWRLRSSQLCNTSFLSQQNDIRY